MKFKSLAKHPTVYIFPGMRVKAVLSEGEISADVPVSVYFTSQFQRAVDLKMVEAIMTPSDKAFIGESGAKAVENARNKVPSPVIDSETVSKQLKQNTVTEDKKKGQVIDIIREELLADLRHIKDKRAKLDFLNSAKARIGDVRYGIQVITELIEELGLGNLDAEDDNAEEPVKEEVPEPVIEEPVKEEAPEEPQDDSEEDELAAIAKTVKSKLKKRSPKAKMLQFALSLGVADVSIEMKQAEIYDKLKARIAEILG